jgi:aspartate carbamoyltransferase catalytic subunit
MLLFFIPFSLFYGRVKGCETLVYILLLKKKFRFLSSHSKKSLHLYSKLTHYDMKKESFVSVADLSKEDILRLMKKAEGFEKNPNQKLLAGKVCATLFFEPSTRTRLSFETAVNRLGGRVIGFSDASTTSSSKGETLKDTIKMVSNYADLIIMRHYLEGAARYASEITDIPIINAGDGANQHPSQTMLDLYSIYKTQGTLENLTITMVGDLKYGRTVHSLLVGMSHFHPQFRFIAPEELKLPEIYKQFLEEHRIPFEERIDFSEEIINKSDILYMTRVQRERFTDLMEYEKVKNVYILKNNMLSESKDNLRILHPLPRVNEIDYDVDDNPKAYYFEQAKNGVFARQAIICDVLGIS